ncbi:TPA: outer membrane beta-barrel protein [Legionella pneumophila]|nr:outer membrane beta-barrel protein [Legionella pneumophila]HAU1224972.1 outer membrane beta-barrel protein [Legionella pneumophila]
MKFLTIVSGLCLVTSTTFSGTMGEKYRYISPWSFEFGPRYWLSNNTFKHELYGPSKNFLSATGFGGSLLASRITNENLTGNAAEGFWQLKHDNGLFLKGYFGGGSLNDGRIQNEDFPGNPNNIDVYSNAMASQKYGSLKYFNTDIGYALFAGSNWQLAGFIGYHYWNERLHDFGCQQLGVSEICIPNIPANVNVMNYDLAWNSLRIGANGIIQLSDTLNLLIDAAYIYSYFKAYDNHNLRPELHGLFYDGRGDGAQVDAIFNWMLSNNLSLGAGGRLWYIKTNGFTHFEQTAAGGQPDASQDTQNSYGLLVQANYKFDTSNSLSGSQPTGSALYSWPGIYFGGNIGYGVNTHNIYIYPSSLSAQILTEQDRSPKNLNVQSEGFLAGGEIGYNWQFNYFIAGIEADLSYTSIGGSNAVTLSNSNITTTTEKDLLRLSTIRGRIGKLASSNMLIFLSGGPALGRINSKFDQRVANLQCSSSFVCSEASVSKNKSGLSIGTGVEYAVNSHATFKAEYLYVDLGSVGVNSLDYSIPPADSLRPSPVRYWVSSKFNYNIVRLGVNYRI